MTDDRGEYRAFGLPPGGYLVLVAPGLAVGTRQRRYSPADDGRGAAGVAGGPLRRLDRRGHATASRSTSAAVSAARVNYAPVFHPGATDIRAAATIALGVSEERTGVDIAIQLVPTATISGTISSHVRRASAVPLGRGSCRPARKRRCSRARACAACPLNRAPTARTRSPASRRARTRSKRSSDGGGRGAAAQHADAVGRGRREGERPGSRRPADAPARRRDQRARRLRGLAADGRRAPGALVRARAARIGRRGSVRAAAAAWMRRDASRSRASRPTRISSRRRGTRQARATSGRSSRPPRTAARRSRRRFA